MNIQELLTQAHILQRQIIARQSEVDAMKDMLTPLNRAIDDYFIKHPPKGLDARVPGVPPTPEQDAEMREKEVKR